ncbi:DegV family protein [Marinitoga sp. 38H-ov]|uniref:DegV family protein n=1 Tax=Marinitoga sp. 38H-ov TaxID=1755814 RepID=UPI0013EDE7B3|nr:DegV family protein [Marinitoga sp. 38H-ov]KAF2955218.1 6-phosphogluconate dehydratase [Marinitoga sp. 38H-ov]
MGKIGVIVDSGCDIPLNILEKYDNLKVVPLRTIIDGVEYDEGTFSEDFLFEHIDGNVKTSLPKPENIKIAIEEMINDGYNDILTFNISKNLSGTYNLFKMISESIKDVKIINIDTLNISIGSGLVVYRALQYIEQGMDLKEIVDNIKRDIKNSTVFYVIPTLKYLARGGRIGKVSAMMGQLLNLKPIISVDDEGVYYTVSKIRGYNKSVEALYKEVLKYIGDNKFIAGVVISGNNEKVKIMQDNFVEKLKILGNTLEIFKGKVSSTLSVHTGQDLIGIGVLKL